MSFCFISLVLLVGGVASAGVGGAVEVADAVEVEDAVGVIDAVVDTVGVVAIALLWVAMAVFSPGHLL